jgi:hypothetical protein
MCTFSLNGLVIKWKSFFFPKFLFFFGNSIWRNFYIECEIFLMGKIPVKFPAAARRLNLAAECEGMGFY